MPEQLTQQEKLFGEREEEYGQLTIPNKKLFPFVDLVNALVSEARLEVVDNSLYAKVVDAANVTMVEVDMPLEGSTEDFTLGANVNYLRNRLQNKPRSENNNVDITIDAAYPTTTLTTERDYEDIHLTRTNRLQLIDPDMIRQSPDMPELETTAEATIPLKPFRRIIESYHKDNPLRFKVESDTLLIGEVASEAEYQSLATLEGDVIEGEADSLFSYDYFDSITESLKRANIEEVTLRLADEYPIQIAFENEYLSGGYVTAPRIRSD